MTEISQVISTQIIFLNSDSNQTIQSFNFSEELLTCNTDETMSISLIQCCFNKNDSYVINETNNSINFRNIANNTTTQIEITPGSYTYLEFAQQVSKQFQPVKCSYLKNQKMFLFTFLEPFQILFEDLVHAQIFGFNTLATSSGLNIQSEQVLDFRFNINNIAIHFSGLSLIKPTADNFNGADVIDSNIVGLIPFNTSVPFAAVNYVIEAPYELYLQDKTLSILFVQITDLKRNNLPQINDYTLVLKISVYKEKKSELTAIMKNLMSMKKVSFLSKYMK
jgi:hypothetical protein